MVHILLRIYCLTKDLSGTVAVASLLVIVFTYERVQLTLSFEKASPLRYRSLIAFFAAALLALGVLSTTAPAAHANIGFCGWVYLQPLGQAGDSCEQDTSAAKNYAYVQVTTFGRAGCVRGIGYYGEPHTNWVCGPRESYAIANLPNDGGLYRGAIRNNNLTYGARFGGGAACCY